MTKSSRCTPAGHRRQIGLQNMLPGYHVLGRVVLARPGRTGQASPHQVAPPRLGCPPRPGRGLPGMTHLRRAGTGPTRGAGAARRLFRPGARPALAARTGGERPTPSPAPQPPYAPSARVLRTAACSADAVLALLFAPAPTTPLTADNLPWHILFGFHESMVTATIAAGRVLMRGRRLLTLDEEAITQRSRELASAVWRRYHQQVPSH